jgi:hypothetical protein
MQIGKVLQCQQPFTKGAHRRLGVVSPADAACPAIAGRDMPLAGGRGRHRRGFDAGSLRTKGSGSCRSMSRLPTLVELSVECALKGQRMRPASAGPALADEIAIRVPDCHAGSNASLHITQPACGQSVIQGSRCEPRSRRIPPAERGARLEVRRNRPCPCDTQRTLTKASHTSYRGD